MAWRRLVLVGVAGLAATLAGSGAGCRVDCGHRGHGPLVPVDGQAPAVVVRGVRDSGSGYGGFGYGGRRRGTNAG